MGEALVAEVAFTAAEVHLGVLLSGHTLLPEGPESTLQTLGQGRQDSPGPLPTDRAAPGNTSKQGSPSSLVERPKSKRDSQA